MPPRFRIALWTLALIATAIAGSACCAALVRLAYSPPGLTGAYSFAAGMRLPVVVVNGAAGSFPVLIGALATFAMIGFAGWRLARAFRDSEMTPSSSILIAQAAAGIALSFFAITFSSDPYAYVIFARAHGAFRLNPYILFGQLGIIHDAILQQCQAFYGDPPPSDNYGPLWTSAAGVVGRFESTSSLWFQFWTQRVVAVAGAVACTAGVLRLLATATPSTRRFGAALFAFHPLVLWEAAVGGHNDFLMLACAVWAFATVDTFPIIAGVLLGAAIGIKFVPVLILPVLVARVLRTSGLVPALSCAAVALAIPVAAFLPYWTGHATILSLESLDSTLGISPTWLLLAPFISTGIANLPIATGWHGAYVDALSWGRLLQFALDVAVLCVVAVVTVNVARGASLRQIWRIVAAFVWTLPSVNSWYVVWLAPAVAFGGAWSVYAWWFGALAALHFAVDAGSVGSVPGAIALAALITVIFMGLPVLIAYWWRRRVGTEGEQAHAG